MHLGIDYGAKLSGNTAICYDNEMGLQVIRISKNKDADKFIKAFINENTPDQIFIDAPLSLPLAYSNKGTDFFYRQCDRDCKAMSPLFLGGLTARAMSLRHTFTDIPFYEAYPKQIAILMNLTTGYKQSDLIESFINTLTPLLPTPLCSQPASWHEVDAILAWLVGFRFNIGIHQQYGNPEEGIIIA